MNAEKGDKTQQVGEGWDRAKMNETWDEFGTMGRESQLISLKLKEKEYEKRR